MKADGHTVASFDVLYGDPKPMKQDVMNLLTPSGFACLGHKGWDTTWESEKKAGVSIVWFSHINHTYHVVYTWFQTFPGEWTSLKNPEKPTVLKALNM